MLHDDEVLRRLEKAFPWCSEKPVLLLNFFLN